MGKWTEAAKQLRQTLDVAVGYLSDEEAISVKTAYRSWQDLVNDSVTAAGGYRFRHGQRLYKTLQDSYIFTAVYEPGAAGTESLFAVIDEEHAGTLDGPIPYDGNMELVVGMYYTQNDVIYLCIRSTGTAVYHPLSDLVGLYVEVIDGG